MYSLNLLDAASPSLAGFGKVSHLVSKPIFWELIRGYAASFRTRALRLGEAGRAGLTLLKVGPLIEIMLRPALRAASPRATHLSSLAPWALCALGAAFIVFSSLDSRAEPAQSRGGQGPGTKLIASGQERAAGAYSGSALQLSQLEAALLEQGNLFLEGNRIHSTGYATFVYPVPSKASTQIGYIRVGGSAALRRDERGHIAPVRGAGCAGGFYPVEPRGYVCLDRSASLSPSGRYLSAMSGLMPTDEALPYRYALSNGAPMYRRLPTEKEWEKEERFLGAPGSFAPLSWGNQGHEVLAELPLPELSGELPWFLREGGAAGSERPLGLVRRMIPLGSMLAYSRVFEHAGRRWLLSADGTVVPADRTRTFRESSFEGVELSAELKLPIAWFRSGPVSAHRFDRAANRMIQTDIRWERLSHVRLNAATPAMSVGASTWLATLDERGAGEVLWVNAAELVLAKRREKLPFGITSADKWIWVSLSTGVLIAYSGEEPVFTTLISPGAGGIPVKGQDLVRASTTPLGIYRVTYKHLAATMSPETGENRSFWIADVPYTQYFHAPFALHVSYWHDTFGMGMSAGCINLSPRDGKRLFGFTEPQLPEGWNGVAASEKTGRGSFVVIER